MNFFDILTLVVLLWAVVSGLRSGFVSQLLSLCGVVIGLILAAQFGPAVGKWLGVDARVATVAGFVVTAVVVMILATVVARLLSRIVSSIGLRWLNLLLGVVLSVGKAVIVLSMLYAAFYAVNSELMLLDNKHVIASRTFKPIKNMANPVVKYLNRTGEKIADGVGKML